jgi:hypothetical protein
MLELPFDPDEFARLGDEFYGREVLPRVTAADTGRIVAIDPQSGTYAIDADQLTAADRVLEQHPGAYLWFRRVGFDYVHRLGHRVQPRSVVADDSGGVQPVRRRST